MKRILSLLFLTFIFIGSVEAQEGKAEIKDPALKAKLEAFYEKDSALYNKRNKIFENIKKVISVEGMESEAILVKMKPFEKEIKEVDKELAASFKKFCLENKDNELPAYILADHFDYFGYEDLNLLCDKTTSYYNHPLMQEAKEQLALLAKRRPGLKYTDLDMKDMKGKAVKLSQYIGKGKYVLVDFWASWCGPCQMEMPNVIEAYNKYHDKGFDVVGVSLDEKAEAWKKGVKDLGLPWHQLSELKGWKGAVCKTYGIVGIPNNILVDPDGIIIASDLREEALQDKLKEIFK